MEREQTDDVIVVGGGLAGLTATTILARAGRRVTVLEQAATLGGRAHTDGEGGFLFNRGPHALYRGGEARAILRRLGIVYSGHWVPPAALGLTQDRSGPLPGGPVSFLTTPFLSGAGRREMVRVLARLARLDTSAWDGVSLAAWLARAVHDPSLRTLIALFARVATYTNAPDQLSAGAALNQTRRALFSGVEYLDGGWQTLVRALTAAAQAAGATVAPGRRVTRVMAKPAGWEVTLADGTIRHATAVVLAVSPPVAAHLVSGAPHDTLAAWAAAAIPVQAACLDVGLRTLPRPSLRVAFGVDTPLYYSVHSARARLAPEGGATIHVARYLAPGEDGTTAAPALEAVLDRVQPGWRNVCVAQRFLPRMVVTEALVTAAAGGCAGRPGPPVPGAAGLYVAGDWVGPAGLLTDAAIASAAQAAEAILRAVPQAAMQRPTIAVAA